MPESGRSRAPAGEGRAPVLSRAVASARSDLDGDRAPRGRLARRRSRAAAWPRRGRRASGRGCPAIDADVDAGQLIAAQLPQVLVMHDPGHGSQVRSCSTSRRAAIRISAGSGRSPRQHSRMRRSMTTAADSLITQAVALRTAGLGDAAPSPFPRWSAARELVAGSAPEISFTAPTVPGIEKPPSRYDVTVRVGKDDGHQPDPAAFAAAASRAASSRNATSSARPRQRRSSA